jgi:MFS family permease
MNRRRWLVLFLIFVGMVVSYIDRGNLSIVADTLMHELGFRPDQMGLLLSAFFWTYGFFQIPAGFFVDRYGIRRTYAAAFLLWSLASASIALSHGLPDILAARLALGLAESVGPVASIAFIRSYFAERESGLPTSIYIGGQMLGPALGTLLGASLLSAFGWRTLFAVTGLGALFWVPAWLYLAPAGGNKDKRAAAANEQPIRWPWRAIFSNPAFWCMSAVIFFASYFWYFVLTWMPAYLIIARGFSTVRMGQVLSIPHFVMIFTNLIAGWIADRFVKKTGDIFKVRVLFAVFGLLGASGVLLLNMTAAPALLLPILLLCSCSYGVYASNFWTIAQTASPVPMVGRAIGYLNTLSQTAGALAPLVTGLTLGPAKDFRFAIWIAGSSPLVACVCVWVAGKNIARLRKNLEAT